MAEGKENSDLEEGVKKVVFLDRDGVINHDSPDYIKTPEEFFPMEKSADAIAMLNKSGWEVIVITNQSMIGRDMATMDDLDGIFQKMKQEVAKAGGRIKDIFFCPHTPDQGCSCRKPLPGMLLQAASVHGIDLGSSCMVGDSVKDILAGKNAGCGATCLVLTGNGKHALSELRNHHIIPDHIAPDLWGAAQWITGQGQP